MLGRTMTAALRILLLGPFQVLDEHGEPIEVTGKKAQALLSYLAVEGGRQQARDELAALLWGDMGDERARHNLRQALSKLRRISDGPSPVVADADMLSLDHETCQVDVREFSRLARMDDPASLNDAIAFYRGPFLDGLVVREDGFDDWLHQTRRRLARQACEVLTKLADHSIRAGQLEQAISHLRRLLTIDRVSEAAHRSLMRALVEHGQRSEALRQFQLCKEALAAELEAEPSAETQALYQQIHANVGSVPAPARVESPAEAEPPSVAVLPLESLQKGEDERYFADGISEDVITLLSRFKSLTVIARESSFAFRDRELPLDKIGQQLQAEFLVSGSVRRAQGRVRVNVQLVEAATGKHLWAQRFDRDLEDIFAVQDEITETVVSTLAGRVEAARLHRARKIAPEQLDAYDCVLRGKDLHHRGTKGDCDSAIELLRQAVNLDADYALAHAWLACAFGQAMTFYPDQKGHFLDEAQVAAERALSLDPTESETHRILAQVFMLRNDIPLALHHQEQALSLNPNDDRIVCAQGEILVCAGRHREALTWIQRAMRLNPFHPPSYWYHLARAHFHAQQPEEAVRALRNVTSPRLRDELLLAAAAAEAGDHVCLERARKALAAHGGTLDIKALVERMPYEFAADREHWLRALEKAQLT